MEEILNIILHIMGILMCTVCMIFVTYNLYISHKNFQKDKEFWEKQDLFYESMKKSIEEKENE